MLVNTLNTNEIKDNAGAEVEFSRLSSSERASVFAQVAEPPARPYRLTVSHQEIGSGLKRRRRGLVRFDKTVMSDVDTTLPVVVSAYAVLDAPVGALTTQTEMAKVLANLMSFLSTTGAATTVLFDGTGNGAKCLLNGDL